MLGRQKQPCPWHPGVSDGQAGTEVESQPHLGLLQSLAFLSAHVLCLADVNVAFQQSAHKVLLDDDNLLPLLHLTIEYHGKEHKGLPFFLASFCSYGFILCSPISPSIHLHGNHVILDLRSTLSCDLFYTGVKGSPERLNGMPRLWFWFCFCPAAGMIAIYFQPPDFKAKESKRPSKRISHSLSLPSSASPLSVTFMLLTLQAQVSIHLMNVVEALVLDSAVFFFLTDAAQAREGPSRETSPREAPASGWAALGLSYKVQWPLHILFTPAVLEK